jgi:hypothetical protein
VGGGGGEDPPAVRGRGAEGRLGRARGARAAGVAVRRLHGRGRRRRAAAPAAVAAVAVEERVAVALVEGGREAGRVASGSGMGRGAGVGGRTERTWLVVVVVVGGRSIYIALGFRRRCGGSAKRCLSGVRLGLD